MCRTAVSVWIPTKSTNSSTSNIARAVSSTCHTTTAAISIGFPSDSLTFITAVSWLRIRTDTCALVVNGLTQRRPCSRTVPV